MHARCRTPLGVALLVLAMAWSPHALAQTRLGLHVTQAELTLWQQRATSGPYKTTSDVSSNSPGDWARITANAALVGSSGRWTNGPTLIAPGTANCVASDKNGAGTANDPPAAAKTWATRLRDAAFMDLVEGVTTHQATVKAELLWQAQASWANWDDESHWCTSGAGKIGDTNPGFVIAGWLTKLLFAYDYLGRGAFTSGERTILDNWFWTAANYWRIETDADMAVWFPQRALENDTLGGGISCTTVSSGCSVTVPYTGGPTIQLPSVFASNRRLSTIRFVALAAMYLADYGYVPSLHRSDDGNATLTTLQTSGTLLVKEFIRHTMYPDGSFAEMCRGQSGGIEDLGLSTYAASSLAMVLEIADHFARRGDTSLYTYTTAAGVCNGTAGSTVGTINDGGSRVGQNKDLLFAMQSIGKYHSDGYARYLGTIGNADHRLDGRDPRSCTWCMIADVYLVPANVYYRDSTFQSVYRRQAVGTVAYPASLPSPGDENWMGENGIYPGVLFMFGGMEGAVWPYPASGTPPQVLRLVSP